MYACEPLEQSFSAGDGQPDAETVSVCVRAAGPTKSSMPGSDTDITDLNVYAYRNGQLEAESYDSAAQTSLTLVRNATYTLYALSGCGEVHAPASESELASIAVAPSKMAMCCREGVVRTADGSSVTIPLTRLFARYELLLDKNLENCDYQITSVQVLQQASSISPFAAASAATGVSSGDSATASDLALLNGGGSAVFYVPENCQGVLLPSNTDPWRKIPDNIPASKRGLCTYLHIEGNWTTSGASADLSINLMLGADDCTDFNVVRNTSILITLSLSDSGTLKSSWKVDMDGLDDDRILSFANPSQTVLQDAGWTQIPLTVSPPDMAYSASFSDQEDPILEAKVENGKVYVRNIYDGELRPSTTLTVTSWDGRVSASTELTLDYNYGAFFDYETHFPEYYGEYGYIDFPSASPQDPVQIEVVGWSATLGPERAAAQNVEYYKDNSNMVEYYLLHSQKKLYILPLGAPVAMMFVFTCHKTQSSVFMDYTKYPELEVDDAIVSESGNRMFSDDQALYFDSAIPVRITPPGGGFLDLNRFKIPSDLLSYKGKTSSEKDRFSDFLTLYPIPQAISSGTQYGCITESATAGDCSELAYDRELACFYVYGTGDYGPSRPTFPITARMTLPNGDVLSSTGTLTGIEAFPSQRYLGEVYNYQLAPGSMRKLTAQVPMVSASYQYGPSRYGVSWIVSHADGADYDIPALAVDGGSPDNYSAGASMTGTTMTFSQMNSSTFPACGMLGLTGTVTNPHTGRTYTGYYTLSVVLYVPYGGMVGVSGPNRMRVSYGPFTEFTQSVNQSIWAACFPSGVRAKTEYGSGSDYAMWGSGALIPGGSDFTISNPATLQEVTAALSEQMSRLRFSFKVGSQTFSELILNRTCELFFQDDSWNSDGSKGYYHLVRQYDLGTFDHGNKYNGLENYLIEAAYESLEDY